MAETEFVDYYELLQASPKASLDTIERLFRYLTKEFDRDDVAGDSAEKFTAMIRGFETLRDPKSRAAYDALHEKQKQVKVKLVANANCLDSDIAQRQQILAALYAKRRQNIKTPGIGDATLEQLVGCPPEVMNFHIWYFKEKGFIQREESGLISITANGVDKIEAIQRLAAEADNKMKASDTDTVEDIGQEAGPK